ncbi:hypothetical protein AC578_3043 [Pseudocercospora eumusae]|uniref:Uncharacterized protein n=1 Tax=Pseudocercospora eumusae TaxID=321146 RepID=A0A139H9U8_9PEZI|nr:hypothetical protein AC578_3043 [Pseudocercospora eumusae]
MADILVLLEWQGALRLRKNGELGLLFGSRGQVLLEGCETVSLVQAKQLNSEQGFRAAGLQPRLQHIIANSTSHLCSQIFIDMLENAVDRAAFRSHLNTQLPPIMHTEYGCPANLLLTWKHAGEDGMELDGH